MPGKNPVWQWMLQPWRFRWYLLTQLPSLAFWGVSMDVLDHQSCRVMLPFSWRTKNPFGSIYFSALAGAAELSTGALLLAHLMEKRPASMLVTHFEMDFVKKAATHCYFSCHDGDNIRESLSPLHQKGDSAEIILYTTGRDEKGEIVARAAITWSIRIR